MAARGLEKLPSSSTDITTWLVDLDHLVDYVGAAWDSSEQFQTQAATRGGRMTQTTEPKSAQDLERGAVKMFESHAQLLEDSQR